MQRRVPKGYRDFIPVLLSYAGDIRPATLAAQQELCYYLVVLPSSGWVHS